MTLTEREDDMTCLFSAILERVKQASGQEITILDKHLAEAVSNYCSDWPNDKVVFGGETNLTNQYDEENNNWRCNNA